MWSDPNHSVRGHPRSHRDVVVLDLIFVLIAVATYGASAAVRPIWSNWFTSGYLNDILAGLMLAAFVDYMLVRGGRIGLTTSRRVAALIIPAGLFWEYVTPLYRPQSTSDPLDLLAYATGSILFLACRQVFAANRHALVRGAVGEL